MAGLRRRGLLAGCHSHRSSRHSRDHLAHPRRRRHIIRNRNRLRRGHRPAVPPRGRGAGVDRPGRHGRWRLHGGHRAVLPSVHAGPIVRQVHVLSHRHTADAGYSGPHLPRRRPGGRPGRCGAAAVARPAGGGRWRRGAGGAGAATACPPHPEAGAAPAHAATGLPSLAGSDWEYHTFKLDASEGLPGKGFLRLKVNQP